MPIPTPRRDESKNDFISRCARNQTMQDEFPAMQQRLAVCNSKWEEKGVTETRFRENSPLGNSIKIEKDKGVIRGVRILNPTSSNGREYSRRAISEICGMANGARVFDQHRDDHAGRRSVKEQIGVIRNPVEEKGGISGDLHVSAREQWLLQDAENIPETIMLSIDAFAKCSPISGSKNVLVESVSKLNSVDLVPMGGTTKSLFEREEEIIDMGVEFKDLTAQKIKENRPDLLESLRDEARKVVEADSDTQRRIVETESELKETKESLTATKKELDDMKAKEAVSLKKQFIDTCVKEAKIPKEADTPQFREILEGLDGEDKIKAAVEDRKKLVQNQTSGGFTGGVREIGRDSDEKVPSAKDFVTALRS